VPTIAGELRRHFRDKGWWLRVPRELQELTIRVQAVADELGPALRRAPTTDEIAQHLGISAEEVLEAHHAAGAHRTISLDGPRDHAEPDTQWVDTIGGDDPGYDVAEAAVIVEHLMSALSSREREILRLRFFDDLTQSEIGAHVGLSQMHVSRMIRQAVEPLRATA
jgi:RNA polymerase sigma-B factor